MKLLPILVLGSLLWLSGCANPPVGHAPTLLDMSAPGGAGIKAPQARAQPGLQASADLLPISAQHAAWGAVVPLAPPADLWERIRRGYAMPDLDNQLVHDRERWYSSRPDYILRMTERSRKYIFHIVEELELRNMPTELALLPFVESAFNPQAVSSAKAAGMWQFMPATGKTFELKQNAFRDDRRDVLASTRAALDYLQKLYGMFGDWQLALAAYNWGEGSVARAIAKNQRAGLGTSYAELGMPMETRFYVPKLQAIKNIVANPQAFNSSLPQIGNHPYFQTVDITRDIDVALAAKLAEVALADFKARLKGGVQRSNEAHDVWYRVDLLFFHRRLRCLVIVDLKLGRFTHGDAGQMHMYLNYARDHWMVPGENPPAGLILARRQQRAPKCAPPADAGSSG